MSEKWEEQAANDLQKIVLEKIKEKFSDWFIEFDSMKKRILELENEIKRLNRRQHSHDPHSNY